MRKVVLLCLIVAAALASLAAPARAQQDAAQFTAEPAPGSSLAPTGGYFLLRAVPRGSLTQALSIRNDSNRPLVLRLAAVDATTGSYGGVSYGLPGQRPTRVGKWISLERRSLRLAPRASTQVSFRLSIPAGVTSGEHLGGLAFWSPASDPREAERGPGQAGASVTVQSRRIIAVLVRFPGPADPRLVVTGVTPAARPDGVYLELGIENRGFGLTKAKGVLSLPEENFRQRFDVDSFVPGTSIAYPIKWMESPREGEHRARVELRYASRTTSWEGTFTVGDKVAEDLVDRGAPGRVEESRSNGTFRAAVGAAALAAAGLLAGTVWLFLRRRRRRRRARRPAPTGPGNGSPERRHDPSLSGQVAVSKLPPLEDVRVAADEEPRGGNGNGRGLPLPAPEDERAASLAGLDPEAPRAAAAERAVRIDRGPVLLQPPAAVETPYDNRETKPVIVNAEAPSVDRRAASDPPAQRNRAFVSSGEPEGESVRVAAAVGAAAVVGGALWLLLRARDGGRS